MKNRLIELTLLEINYNSEETVMAENVASKFWKINPDQISEKIPYSYHDKTGNEIHCTVVVIRSNHYVVSETVEKINKLELQNG
jgi:hypothetical protein